MDDLPPPPYTETDIYSRSGRSPVARAGSNDDDVSVTASSSRSTTIYTPPDTPRESHSNLAVGDDHHTTTSAHSYFESRPATRQVADQNFVAALAIADDASPDNFPYPGWAPEHDTTEQDWHTFLNYLIPDHSSRSNSHIVDRKLQAENDAPSSPTGRSITEAQLGQIKSTSDLHSQGPHDINATIREWNDGFFGPRGVTIRRAEPSSPDTSQMPSVEHIPLVDPQPRSQEQAARPRWNPFRPFEANNRGLRIGRLAIDGDRVSFGDSFEVDRNGVRWNGQPLDGNPNLPGAGARDDFPPQGRGFGDPGMGRGQRGRWWRSGHPGRNCGPRDRSRSSASSSSSSSSSDSDSDFSIGSLPEWDDLKDAQLPVAKQSVSAWLAHPEQPVTRDMLKAARSNIKAAKNASPPTADPAWEANRQAMRQEVRSLLTRFKDVKREQKKAAKAVRKERKEQKKALKRERRGRRRAERREQKNHEREFVRARREAERNARRGDGGPSSSNIFEHPISQMPPTGTPVMPGTRSPNASGFFGPGPGPFGGPGFLGRGGRGMGGPFGHPHPPWESHVQNAQRQAEQARAHAQSQADQARAHAQSQADLARAQADTARAAAQSMADVRRAQAQAQADKALRAADAARAEAAAAVAAWTSSRRHPFLSPSMSSLRVRAHQQSQSQSSRFTTETNNSNDFSAKKFETKYEEADALESQIVVKANELLALRERIEEEAEATPRDGGGEKGVMEEKNRTQAERDAETLERDIDGLTKDVERLRFEADEEMARKMAEE